MIDWVCGLFVGGAVLAGVLEAAATATPPGEPPRARGDGRCPYCHDALEPPTTGEPAPGAEALVAGCARCATRHHLGCWTEHGGCSVHGCGGTGYRLAREGGRPRAGSGAGGAAPDRAGALEAVAAAADGEGAGEGLDALAPGDPDETPATPLGNALPTEGADAAGEAALGDEARPDLALVA